MFANNTDQLLQSQRKRDNEACSVARINNSKLNLILHKDKTHAEMAIFLHAACFSPVTSTCCKAIENVHFTTRPGLSSTLIKNNLIPSIATAK